MSKISFLAKDLEQQTFFAISKDRKDFIDINEDGDLNHAVLGVKPSGGMWASIPSNHLGMVSKWHEWCLDEGFGLEKLNYVTEFELKSDAKVLYIKSVEDLEILEFVRIVSVSVVFHQNIRISPVLLYLYPKF